MPDVRLIFMGTPVFAVSSLEVLLAGGCSVVAVVTAPDRPRGRGRPLRSSPVKEVAHAHGIPVLQPTNLMDPAFLRELARYQADLQVVVAFRVLPRAVWSMPRLGTVNLHASLLPQYRGAAPIPWAIMHGEQETGVTTFFIEETIDTGHLLFQEKEPIYASDNAGTLHTRLQRKGAQLLLKTVKAIASGNYTSLPQVIPSSILLRKAPKLYKEDGRIDWHQEAEIILNFIRGLSPYPAAWTIWNGLTYKILSATPATVPLPVLAPGEIYTDGKRYLYVGTRRTPLSITMLQLAGARPMDVPTFLRGRTV